MLRMNSFYLCRHVLVWMLVVSCSVDTAVKNSGKVEITGLGAPVEILRDKWGVNHIYAENEHDLFFAQGYAAAKDRLFQFEMWRRRATGTVAEILGPDELPRDISARLFKYRENLKDELNHYHPRGESIVNAYVEGVNAFIDEILSTPEKLPVEFALLGLKPEKWTPEVVISRHNGLRKNVKQELDIGIAVARVGASKVKELMWFHPGDPQLELDKKINGDILKPEILALYNANVGEIKFGQHQLDIQRDDSVQWSQRLIAGNQEDSWLDGSNNWTVAGAKTVSGYAMLANDPHRAITVPSLRYMVHLVGPGWNVAGGGEPAIPGVAIGHNEHGAWGLTIHQTDAEDLYVYELNSNDLRQYKYKGKWVSMKEVIDTIAVKGAPVERVTLRYTVHGPVTYIDSMNHVGYAVRCGWLEPGGAPYLATLRVDQAQNWDEFREACRYFHLPGLNMVWADRRGDIGWQVVGIFPSRNNSSGLVPIPGDGRYDWTGFVPIEKRAHIRNPQNGYFATANQHVTPIDYVKSNTIGYTWSDPFRGERINEVLDTDKKLSMEDMKSLQSDYFSVPARTLVPMLAEISVEGLSKAAKDQLSAWDFVMAPTSVQAGIYAMWERHIIASARKKFVPAELQDLGEIDLQLMKIIDWLKNPDQKFGRDPVDGRNRFLRECFESAVAELEEKFGNSPDHWQYGQARYKHTAMESPVAGLLNERVKSKVDIGPLPRGGNAYTPNSTGNSDNQNHGATFRIIADVGDWDKTVMTNSPGQSGDPSSRYYNNLFGLWATNQYFPSYFSREQIEAVTEEGMWLMPAEENEK
jgi:penicillin G amidase